ncbi:MAG: glycosyltransferase [Azospirillaceae bacterium]
MTPDILFAAGALFALMTLHPFATYPASLWVAARLAPARPAHTPAPRGRRPRIAICCCAYNEAAVIRQKAENLLALKERWPGARLHVYDDGSADATAAHLADYADRIDVVTGPGRMGKSHGMNVLVERAGDADILVFTDANVHVDGAALDALVRHFDDPSVGCVSGHLVYTNAGDSGTAATGGLYWRFEEALKRLESRVASTLMADGSLFALRRDLHRPVPPDLIDDMVLSLGVFADGWRVIQAEDAVAYERTSTEAGEEFRRKVRIACQAVNAHRALRPRLGAMGAWRRYVYLSHKVLRWLVVYNAAAAAALLALAAGLAWGPVVPLAVVAVATAAAGALWRLRRSVFDKASAIALAFLAVGVGVARSFAGERFVTWDQAATAR